MSRDRLHQIILDRSFRAGAEFTLSSGQRSSYYFDLKATSMDAEGGGLIAEAILARPDIASFAALGGIAIGGIPIAVRATALAWSRGQKIRSVIVRERAKAHGTTNQIEGLPPTELLAGLSVLVIEDVTTTGASMLKGIEALRAAGAIVTQAQVVVLRGPEPVSLLAQHGVALQSLYHFDETAGKITY